MRVVTGKDVEDYAQKQARLRTEVERTLGAEKEAATRAADEAEQKNNAANNDYLTKLVNYIPVPVVAAFLAVEAAIKASQTGVSDAIYWLVVIVLAAGAAWYAWTDSKKPPSPNAPAYGPSKTQTSIAVVSFFVWVFALGGPFATLPGYQSVYGAIAVILWVFVIPMFIQT